MKAHRNSEGQTSASQTSGFFHRQPDCVLRVENHELGIRIRATRGSFSARDKDFFVRYLAAEGFIPDRYRWFSHGCDEPLSGIEWCVDDCRSRDDLEGTEPRRRANASLVRLLVCASVLWVIQLAFLFLKSR
jgi:hypothetical protein